ncbi:hypothetical protein CRG98_018896 [Punica granatum]|uniref:G-patch domain-containing protein n=1 Tax=Punica granatum TaxID=22663 RepID=A0A2I0JWN6_PUNGR|nr:hypothetical protein CRG98_018896 [Punica granatum]
MVMFAETPVDRIFLRTAAEFWDPKHAVFNFQGTELAPTIEEYTALIQRPTPTTHGIFVPNPFTTVQSQLSTLLRIPAQDIHEELHQRWDQGIRITWLSDWTLLRAMTPTTGGSARQDEGIPAPTADLASSARPPFLLITSVLLHLRRALVDRTPYTSHPASRAQLLGMEAFLAMAEGDNVDISEEVNPSVPTLSQLPPTRASPPLTPAGVLLAYSGALPTHLPPPASSGAPLPTASLTSAATDNQARIAALEGTVNQMATNMAELLALLRGPNRASSSSTPLPGQGPTADPTPWVPQTQAPENVEPHAGFSYQAPPPINTTFHESGTPTHAAQFASPTHFFPEANAEQERRLKRMEETIRALQAGDARPDARYGDCSLFPGMRLPPKFKEDLSRKFTDQYRYCAETPPTLLELSTKEMARGQRFEEYAAKWRAQAAKHIPPISEAQQIQLFHSTLRGVYYSHLLAHTSSFSNLIEAWKKLDLGIKLGRMEDPTNKGDESSKKAPAALLRDKIQRRIDSNRLTFNAVRPPNVQANPFPDHRPSSGPSINMISICVSERDEEAQENPLPFVINYTPEEPTVGFTRHEALLAPFVIDIPAREPYSDSKVPWAYEGNVGSLEQQFSVMGVTRSGRVYETSAAKDKGKTPAVEVGAALESSLFPSKKATEEEAEAFMKIVKASEYKVVDQMAKSPAHISLLALLLGSEPHREALLRVLTTAQVPKGTPPDKIEETVGSIFSNTISFSDDELPLLLERPWIHSAGAVPSSLHQRLKFIVEERLITVKEEEDYTIYKETAVPYISIGDDENLPFHSFETISVIRDYGESGPSRADRMIGKVLLRNNYIPGTGLGARGQGISRPIEVEGYKHRRGLGFRPSCHEIIEARKGNHLHRLAAYYGRLNSGALVPPLSHFFPGPSHTIGGTLDGPSSDSDDTPATPSVVYAVTEEIPSGVHIRLAQENEELHNWTSVPHYSAVIADV